MNSILLNNHDWCPFFPENRTGSSRHLHPGSSPSPCDHRSGAGLHAVGTPPRRGRGNRSQPPGPGGRRIRRSCRPTFSYLDHASRSKPRILVKTGKRDDRKTMNWRSWQPCCPIPARSVRGWTGGPAGGFNDPNQSPSKRIWRSLHVMEAFWGVRDRLRGGRAGLLLRVDLAGRLK